MPKTLRVSAFSVLGAALLLPVFPAFPASRSNNITIRYDLQVPGKILKPGTYSFAIEDRLHDRAIVRVTSAGSDDHYLLLAVPSKKASANSKDGLDFFPSRNPGMRTLRGWMCRGCAEGLEFAYPKVEAVRITRDAGESVLAVDPTYDKLPANLSPDDMNVVTLWLLSPERVLAGKHGEGVKAAKYESVVAAKEAMAAPGEASGASASSSVSESSAPGTPTRIASAPKKHLPRTAGNTPSLALWGALFLTAALGVRRWRIRVASR